MTIYTILQVLAPFNLHVIKRERTAGLLSNDLSRIVDVRCLPTTPRSVFSVRNSSDNDTTPPALAVVSGLHSKISRIGPLHRRCRAVASLPTLTTTSSFYRRDSAPPGRLTRFSTSPLQQTSLSSPL